MSTTTKTVLKKPQTKKNNNEELKPKLGKYYLLSLSIIILVIFIIYFCVLKVNPKEYVKYILDMKADVMNEKLMQLKNANTIYNLPEVVLQSNNANISNLIDCKNKLQYLGLYTTDTVKLNNYRNMCKTTCGGSGELLLVETNNDYVYENEFVESGIYCTVEPPICNLNTGYVVATVNSATCVSKYPRLFGGPTASNIIACNDEFHPGTGSVLWDYANNEAVNPSTVLITHENETLPDGSYRFRCKYNETRNRNPYIPHPLDRFHPIIDKCNNTIYAADYSVHADVTETNWECNCGDFAITRVKHLDSNNPKSICTSCYRQVSDDTYTVPFICFRENAPYTLPHEYQPCIEYSREGNLCDTVNLKIINTNESRYFINTKLDKVLHKSDLSNRYEIYKNL